jgi:uncharacterized membrane protein YdbT with pleckstrin-like domain
MLYIMESLSPGEHIIQPTGYHWMFVFQKFISFAFFTLAALALVAIGSVYDHYPTLPPWKIPQAIHQMGWGDLIRGFWSAHLLVRIGAFLLMLMGLLQVVVAMIIRATTEIAVTNRRLIFKRGIIARNMNELKIENIEGIILNQTVMGRMFNYGQMSAHGTGVGEIHFPDYMADPVSFRRAIQSARSTYVPSSEDEQQHQRPRSSAPQQARSDEENELLEAAARHPRGGGVDI